MNFAVFASGNGGNLQAIIRHVKRGSIKSNLKLVVSDKPDAYCLTRAKKAGIASICVEPKSFKSRIDFDKAVLEELKKNKIHFIVLAGFMRILTPDFIRSYRNKILNIHPSLLPAFKGAHAIKDAFDYGVKATGATVHFVTDELDDGPIIMQGVVKVDSNDTLDDVCHKIHLIEHRIYPKSIALFEQKKLKIKGRCVVNL